MQFKNTTEFTIVNFCNRNLCFGLARYGADAAKATDDGLNATGAAAMTAYNVSFLGTKAIAKRIAKDTGVCIHPICIFHVL